MAVKIAMQALIVVAAKAGTQGHSVVFLMDSRLRGNDEKE